VPVVLMRRLGRWSVSAFLLIAPTMAGAQVRPDSARPPVAQDTAARPVIRTAEDSARDARAQARIDSLYRAKLADTIKAPLAHFERPDQPELSTRLRFSREQILSSGAVNIADILERVPGVMTFRTGWLAGSHTANFNGDFSRVRIFLDGVERDAVEARNGGVLDLDDVPLWGLDEIMVERVAGEVRVWLKSWTVRRTTPYSRVDIFTGDLNTNGFRGLLARRFGNGFSLQLLGQQLATQTGRVSAFSTGGTATGAGDGNQQLFEGRIGWARGKFTVDMHGTANARDRDPQTAREGFTNLPAFKGSRREAYGRIAYGDSARGLWTQALVGVLRTRLEGIAGAVVDTTLSRDSVRARTQQIVAVGYRASWWHASVVDRVRPVNGTAYHAPAARAGIGNAKYQLFGYGESRRLDSLRQFDVSAVARPTSWLSLVASQSQRTPDDTTGRAATTSSRAEVALRFRRLWLGGGVIREGAITYASPTILGAPAAMLPTVETTGVLASARGALYKDLSIDVQAVSWDVAQYSRPKLSVRTELALVSNWLSRFPKGQFSINARIMHEIRDPVPFYWTTNGTAAQRVANDAQLVTGLLEIRLQSATIFYQYRNLTGRAYEQIPGLTMPPAVQMYGMRWEFWN